MADAWVEHSGGVQAARTRLHQRRAAWGKSPHSGASVSLLLTEPFPFHLGV